MNSTTRSKPLGIFVAVASVAAVTGIIFPLRHAVPAVSTGVLYLLAVLLLSTYWGLALGLFTSVASAAAFDFFHLPPTGRLDVADGQDWLALGVYLAVAAVASGLANAARERAEEAEAGRRDAHLAADLAGVILGAADPTQALPEAGGRIADAFGLANARIEFGWVAAAEPELALPLVDHGSRVGTLLVPRATDAAALAGLERRALPALTALIAAAQKRRELEQAVVETKALRHSDVLKTALLRTVSHDLRTPLTAIRAAAAGVASTSATQQEREEMAALIASQSTRLTRLVENLLDLSRLEAGSAPPRADWCAVPEVVEAAIAGLEDPGRR